MKDLFDTAGIRTTYGSAVFAEHVPGKYESAVRLSGSSLARHSTVMYELLRRLAS